VRLGDYIFERLYGKVLVEKFKEFLRYTIKTSKGKVVVITQKKFTNWMYKTYGAKSVKIDPVWWTVIIVWLKRYAINIDSGPRQRSRITIKIEDLPKIIKEMK